MFHYLFIFGFTGSPLWSQARVAAEWGYSLAIGAGANAVATLILEHGLQGLWTDSCGARVQHVPQA